MDNSTLDLLFPSVGGKEVVSRFDGGDITSDAGVLFVSLADRKVRLSEGLAGCIEDKRQQSKVVHSILDMLRERVYGICSGYEDVNDLDRMGSDPALKLACERLPGSGADLASQPTICRLENGVGRKALVRIGKCLAERGISRVPSDSRVIYIDVDPTDDPCHGQQEFEFFNKFYDCHCYLPLHFYVTGSDGRARAVGSLLRPGNAGATKGLASGLRILLVLLRKRFPDARIILRADGSFGNAGVIRFCEDAGIDYVLGLSQNRVLHRLSVPVQMDACLKYKWEGDGCREFGEFRYGADTWEGKRRVIVKAEITRHELNPRFVVTSLGGSTPQGMYELYCARGDRENRIKEMKLDLASGRTSCHGFLANQFRLLLVTAACVLMNVVQEALSGTKWASAQIETIRVRLLKVGARVVESCRRVWLHLPTAFPDQQTWSRLRDALT